MAKTKAAAKSSNSFHPPYFKMITEAISTLKDKTGSSEKAITKFIKDKYENLLPPNFNTILSVQLKKMVKSEKITKANNSFKISESTHQTELSATVTQKKNNAEKDSLTAEVKEKKCVKKTYKSLNHVKTPEGLKNGKKSGVGKGKGKIKRLSEVKTPEGLKKNFKIVNPSRKDKKIGK